MGNAILERTEWQARDFLPPVLNKVGMISLVAIPLRSCVFVVVEAMPTRDRLYVTLKDVEGRLRCLAFSYSYYVILKRIAYLLRWVLFSGYWEKKIQY